MTDAAAGVHRGSRERGKGGDADHPLVFAMVGDPVELGMVASLNRPLGNLTGVTGAGETPTRRDCSRESTPWARNAGQ